ncbi:hypothetical protein GI374_11610 [Paracoccus sp. S-4012]|uniref:hypothetical protein n=1 Tax=Paracoccus sp. S-4012 TaxID=2665648 RepID=UPI0012AFFF47|nr:hypothetical protein [Paracoccus sp. S-4012]MRX51082.1 hypothetical protein [Paracoccus sp. S-4012]
MTVATEPLCQRVPESSGWPGDPPILAHRIARAVHEGNESVAERVIASYKRGRSVWRVLLPEEHGGITYAMVSDVTGTPITVLTQEQVRVLKDVSIEEAEKAREARDAKRRTKEGWRRHEACKKRRKARGRAK